MAVLRPLKLVIDNYPEGQVEQLEAVNNPEDPAAGKRQVPFSRVLYIEQDDFKEDAPKKYFRLAPGAEVRLRWAYLVRCVSVVKDPQTGEVTEVHCTYDPETRGGTTPDGRKVKGTIHWVSADHALQAEVRLYDRLFNVSNPDDDPEQKGYLHFLNPQSLETITAFVEPSLGQSAAGDRMQFERVGYFCVDPVDSQPDKLVFNRTVTLRDAWAKIEGAGG